MQAQAVEHIRDRLNTTDNLTRTVLADELCEHFGFFDPRGDKQRAGCLKALREMDKAGVLVLPAPGHIPGKRSPRRLEEPVPAPRKVPAKAGQISGLRLILVDTQKHMRIWNELMIREHPRGAALLVGRQIRYLVQSDHGWLGGLSFSSAALQLEARDKWIGWDPETRRANLHYVVNMSRFLIRSTVSCRNLASKLLAMAIGQLPKDFKTLYGYRPLLVESFVDTSHFEGTCYRAANFQCIGQTKGRGRQGRSTEKPETVKAIYVYPLEKNFRLQMVVADGAGLNKLDTAVDTGGLDELDIADGLDGDKWAENEFAGAPIGDKRLSRRLVEAAAQQAQQPGRAYSGVAAGDWPKVKGYYRMIDKPDDSAVTMPNILLPHRERTIRRMKAQPTVLCIQDGSDLNYNNLSQCEGLGVIGTNQTEAQSKGLHLHSTFAVTPDGLPLGVLRAECSAADLKPKNGNRPGHSIPIEEKKTFRWIEGVRDCAQLKNQMPNTDVICVMDREADFFELFDEHRDNCSNVDLLVRAQHDRKITGEDKLFDTVRQSLVQAQLRIKVPRQSARPKKSKQKVRPKRPARNAEVCLRFVRIQINPPWHHKRKEPISVWVVHVREEAPPVGTDPVEWFLLTTIDIKTCEDALNCVKWYCLRWRIEDWHRVLKSGCQVEQIGHKTADRLRRAIAIKLVIAWRIMLMTLLGREVPELPSEVLFSDLEIEVLRAYAKKKDCLPRIALAGQLN